MRFTSVTKFIAECLDAVRFWEWYQFLRLNTILALVLLAFTGQLQNHVFSLVYFIIYTAAGFVFGYCINNLADSVSDGKIGKNRFTIISQKTTILITLISLGVLLSWIPYYDHIGIMGIVVFGLLLALFYSMKPFRLKERGVIGLVAVTIAERLPFMLFYFLLTENREFVVYLFLWLVVNGLIIELHHQFMDYTNDCATKTATHAVRAGKMRVVYETYGISLSLIAVSLIPIYFGSYLLSILLLLLAADTLRLAQFTVDIAYHKRDSL